MLAIFIDFSSNFMQIPCFNVATTLLLFICVLLVACDNFVKEFDDDDDDLLLPSQLHSIIGLWSNCTAYWQRCMYCI